MPTSQNIYRREKIGFEISTDPARLDHVFIHGFLSKKTEWRAGISPTELKSDLAGSLCFGLYFGEAQIGFASVTTDFTTFAYLTDVFVLEKHRGQGLAKWLLETVMAYPGLQGGVEWMLSTEDAQGLYEKVGFSRTSEGGGQMTKCKPNRSPHL